ncbi:enoyl-CoA hydratase/isomerase family protein [Candidatus Acetothermia bacterium]|nr:enoyl-CoA hydratase/isomerase family protein [Candidatus Acetothermia bacterium]MBI3643512.1 enoyl-CoA hydratase/isomerase family protein [Candidatus Acetothermia bacterium]
MKLEDIKTIAVIGAGTMGHGIAELAALAGYNVVMRDINEELVQKGYKAIEWSLNKFAEKGTMTPDQAKATLKRVKAVVDIKEAVKDADFVIEAAPEIMKLKKELFTDLDKYAQKHAILASNTSSLSITEISKATKRPGQVVGMHYFNPPVKMALVEVIKGKETDENVMKLTVDLTKKFGKSPIRVEKDTFGFIVNRVLVGPFMFESAWIVSRGQATVEEVDSRMKYYEGFPMGPFELQDLTGIDIGYHLTKEAGLPVPSLIEDVVKKNRLGRKTGAGFYQYKDGQGANFSRDAGKNFDPITIYALMVNEACQLIDDGVSVPSDIDLAVQLGAGFPEGILARADRIGMDKMLSALEGLAKEHKDERYKPSNLLKKMVKEGKTGQAAGEGFYKYGSSASAGAREFKAIKLEVDKQGIAWITLNRPHRLNAINSEMREELPIVFADAAKNDAVRVVVIKGAGDKAFSAGADITEFAGGKPYQFAELGEFFNAPAQFPKPVIAAIDGFALGGGLELALACDFRIASKRSELGQPEIKLGLIPGGGGTQRLVRLIGPSRTKELVMIGDRISAEQAEQWGLINKVVDNNKFDGEVRSFAEKLASGPPIAIRFTKKVVDWGGQAPMEAALFIEREAFGLLFSTEDMIEGTTAFLMKKKPEFKGK